MVCSQGDLFCKQIKHDYISEIFASIRVNKDFDFLILTKRPENALLFVLHSYLPPDLPNNLWLLVSAENQHWVDARVPKLLDIPAKIKGISLEPLIDEVDISNYLPHYDSLKDKIVMPGIDWVIVGCESGKDRRPCKLEWVRQIVDKCQYSKVPVFVKQLDIDGKVVHNIEKFPKDLRIREFPNTNTPPDIEAERKKSEA